VGIEPLVFHVPHSSTAIPAAVRDTLLLDERALEEELLRITDHYTDELFGGLLPGAAEIVYAFSRLVVDPERFDDDELELATAHGMGVIYTHGSRGQQLRETPSQDQRSALLARFYHPHHQRLEDAVRQRLERFGTCLVLDCHSFPREPLPIERSRSRPDICIGTDEFHTPTGLRDAAVEFFRTEGLSVRVDDPFAGALVPTRWYRKDQRVSALMIEVGRWLYMDESSGRRGERFGELRGIIKRWVETSPYRLQA
jgi:N-formylglutamate deformylase